MLLFLQLNHCDYSILILKKYLNFIFKNLINTRFIHCIKIIMRNIKIDKKIL